MKFTLPFFIAFFYCFLAWPQGYNRIIGRNDVAPYGGQMVAIGKATYYSLRSFNLNSFSLSRNMLIKLDHMGKTVWSKRTSDSSWQTRRIFTIQSKLYVEEGKIDSNRILQYDTNGIFIKGRYIPRMTILDIDNEKILFGDARIISGTNTNTRRTTLISWLNPDLEFIKAKTLKDSLGLPLDISIKRFAVSDSSLFFSCQVDGDIIGQTFNSYIIKIDTNLMNGSVYNIYENERFSRGSMVPVGQDSIFISNGLAAIVDLDTIHYSIFNKKTDTIYHKKIRQKRTALDTISSADLFINFITGIRTDFLPGRIFFRPTTGGSSNFFYSYLVPQRNHFFLYRFNSPKFSFPSFNQTPLPHLGIGHIHSPESIPFPFRKGFAGSSLAFNVNANDPANCLAKRDSALILDAGKVKIKRVSRLFLADTLIDTSPAIINPVDFPICNMDFCNPLTYSGLGPDITTCADSVQLNGTIVYPGQKLEWSTGDTTLRVKIPVTAQLQSISIKISGICGIFEDTLVLRQSGAQAVSFNQPDSLLRCRPILLKPITQAWQNPTWRTPRGIVAGDTSHLADTSGTYIIQNGADICARRDTVFVEIRPTVQPILSLPDTVKSCLPVSLTATGNPLVNLRWSTPQGLISGVSQVVANFSGKYRVENEQLGCVKADSVFVLLRNPQTVEILPGQDSLLTCGAVNLRARYSRGIAFRWRAPDGQVSSQPQIVAGSTGWYKAQNDTGNCLNRDSIFVQIRDTAAADFILQASGRRIRNSDTLVEESQLPLLLTAITQTQARLFRWYLNGALQTGNEFTQNFSLPEEGLYRLRLVTTGQDSCLAKAEKEYRVRKVEVPPIFLPTLVTANGDGKNDAFAVPALSFYPQNELVVFNRWGKEVFSASPYANNWPGSEVEGGVYFYRLKAGEKTFSGWVLVER